MAEMKPLGVSYERCHELLEVCEPSDPQKESGLKWKVRRGGRANVGSWAGWVWKKERSGKIRKDWMVRIDGKNYIASRIISFMTHGVDPYPLEIDHKDRNSMNNSVDNLRLGDAVLQSQNRGTRSDSTSGVKGVSWHRGASKWTAYIKVEDKIKHLGYYVSIKEAAEARNAAVKKYWPEEVWAANLIDLDSIKD